MTEIKARIIEETLLILLNSEELYILKTDASDQAIKAILKQKINKNFHPVAFYFRKFTESELNYEIHDKKLLIIIAVFKK